MRLPWVAPTASAAPVDSTELRHCKRCGERSPVSMERCGACGALLATD
jgi:ribosomal protein L37E